MKMKLKKSILPLLALMMMLSIALAGCGQNDRQTNIPEDNSSNTNAPAVDYNHDNSGANTTGNTEPSHEAAVTELVVRFGDDGQPFVMHLYDNETASAIAHHVGTADWRLPIYHYDDYDNWEVMQYYDIPSRYEIPSAPESITSEQAGTGYYSEPNRIILFFQDAEVSGEYTPVGYFDYSEEFLTAVQENPVIEGWGNKIVCISDGE